MTGWDFIVEFPMDDPQSPAPLDGRSAVACAVQLKSTAGESGSRISVKLSAIERLAKDPRPALIVVLRLRADGEPLAGYVIHLLDAELARILKRLRAADAAGKPNINQVTISFDYRKSGRRFSLMPDGLKAALEAASGPDTPGYIQEKQRQLAELGYEDGGIEGEAVVWIDGPQHFNDMILGLQPIRPKRLQLFDNRFGIRLPYRGALLDTIDEFRIQLPRLGACTVLVQGGVFQPVARFTAEVLAPPPLADGPWLIIRHPDFDITFREEGLNFQTSGSFDHVPRTLERWAMLIRALEYLAGTSAHLSIQYGSPDLATISFDISQSIDGPYVDQLPAMAKLLEGWRRLLEMAGMEAPNSFTIDALWAGRRAAMAIDMLLNPAPVAFFEFDNIEDVGDEDGVDAIYFDTVEFVGVALSYAVRVKVKRTGETEVRHRSVAFEPLDVRSAVADLEEYGLEQTHRHRLAVVIHPENVTLVAPNEKRMLPMDS